MADVSLGFRDTEGLLAFIEAYPYFGAAILVALLAAIYWMFRR